MIYLAIVLGPLGFFIGALTGSLINALVFSCIGLFGPTILTVGKMEKEIKYLKTKNIELVEKVEKLSKKVV